LPSDQWNAISSVSASSKRVTRIRVCSIRSSSAHTGAQSIEARSIDSFIGIRDRRGSGAFSGVRAINLPGADREFVLTQLFVRGQLSNPISSAFARPVSITSRTRGASRADRLPPSGVTAEKKIPERVLVQDAMDGDSSGRRSK